MVHRPISSHLFHVCNFHLGGLLIKYDSKTTEVAEGIISINTIVSYRAAVRNLLTSANNGGTSPARAGTIMLKHDRKI